MIGVAFGIVITLCGLAITVGEAFRWGQAPTSPMAGKPCSLYVRDESVGKMVGVDGFFDKDGMCVPNTFGIFPRDADDHRS